MTPTELDVIRERWVKVAESPRWDYWVAHAALHDMPLVLAEVDRLTAALAHIRDDPDTDIGTFATSAERIAREALEG